MYCSLILGAQLAPIFTLASLSTRPLLSGDHCSGRYSGKYELCFDEPAIEAEVSIPSRDKHMNLYLSTSREHRAEQAASSALTHYSDTLATLDSAYPGATWLQKLEIMREAYLDSFISDDFPHSLIVNTESTHGSFSLIANGDPLYMLGVYDPQLKTAHLVWSTEDHLASRLRNLFPLRLLVYRFPVIVNRAVFIPAQTICAHWWRYCKSEDILFAFNALELKLFRGVS